MTIADKFNAIAVAQGGTASADGTIVGAIDALNDALAGSDQKRATTIEDAIGLLGAHIGGGSADPVTLYIRDLSGNLGTIMANGETMTPMPATWTLDGTTILEGVSIDTTPGARVLVIPSSMSQFGGCELISMGGFDEGDTMPYHDEVSVHLVMLDVDASLTIGAA